MLELIIVAAIFAAIFYYYVIKPLNYWDTRGVKHGNQVIIVGDSWKSMLKLESFTEMVSRVYNAVPGVRYSGMFQFTTPTLVIKDPELLKQICVKDFDHFVDHRSFISENGDPLWGKNLFSLKGEKWRDMRPILSPSFTSSKMRAMFVLMSECADNLTKFFLKKDKDIVEVEMKDIFTRFTNDIIATTAFGIRTDSLNDQTNEFYMMGKDATDFSGWRKSLRMFGILFMPKLFEKLNIGLFDKHVSNFFIEIINNTITTRQKKGIIRPDMIHLLMEAQKDMQQKEEKRVKDVDDTEKKSLTNIDIAAQAMVFFFAGFDSVSSLMCFMAHELAVNPDIQRRLRDEINETRQDCKGDVTYDALNKMTYMDMVVSETLRKWPSAVAVDRVCTKPYTIPPKTPEEKSIHLNVNDVLWIPIFGIHRDPEKYPNPDRFDPERFNEENKGSINPYNYLPFGLGPRSCIGNRFALLETKVVMFHLLSHFEIRPISKTGIPLKISKKHINLFAEGGFWLGLKRI